MVRLGLLANPDAGLGGRLGLKGSDGQAELARSMGAEDRSGPRLSTMLEHFSELRRAGFDDIEWLTSEGRMGTDWLPKGAKIGSVSTVHSSSAATSASDTAEAVAALLEAGIDLLVYAGGDGTTRDIVAALESAGQPRTPVIGVPTGVKMHSGCFAASLPGCVRRTQPPRRRPAGCGISDVGTPAHTCRTHEAPSRPG